MSAASRRVFVAFDASCEALRSLDGAAEVAARLGAELTGIFIEDTTLLNLAALPCGSEVGGASGCARSLNAEVIGRTLKGIAERARLAMARAAEHRQVRWTFTTARGSLLGELLNAANPKEAAPVPAPRGAWRVVSLAARSVLLLHPGPCVRPEGTAVVLIDAGCASLRNLPTALALADRSCTRRTLVVIVSDSPLEAGRQRARVAGVLAAEESEAKILTRFPLDADGLRAFLGTVDCGALVIGSGTPLLEPGAFAGLVENSGYPVFVVC